MSTQAKPGVIPAHFPAAGIDVSDAFFRQAQREVLDGIYARSTAMAVNVLGYDTQGGRLRGGSRPGLARLGPQVLDYLIQQIDQIVTDDDDVQSSNSGRVVNRIAIALGNLYSIRPGEDEWVIATDNATPTPPLNASGVMQSAANVQNLYFADGVNETYFNPRDNTMNDWVASEGTLPVDEEDNRPRLICTWRGRTIVSGLLLDGQAIFASRVGDPDDWDYAPVPFDAAQAWAFSTGQQGVVGDKVTGLFPYNDDTLIIFCQNSIEVLQGDVTLGGRRTFVTDSIGAAWGKAFCRDPAGNVYFMSNDMKVYVMAPGAKPQQISQPVAQLIEGVNTGETNIVMGYDYRTQSIIVFMTPIAQPAATRHLILELRTGAWSELVFANKQHDPLCCCAFDGNEEEDRGLFWGSWLGYVYCFDHDAEDDDGTPIDSEVAIGPFLTPTGDEVMISELQGVLGAESGDVDFEVLVGRTPEQAIASTSVYSGTFTAGRNYTHPVRKAAHAMYVKVKSTAKWASEVFRIVIGSHGALRQRAGK